MKKSFVLAFLSLVFGYWLGNATFPQKYIQHTLDYPIAFTKIVTASHFTDAKEAHAFVISTNYLSLEEMSTKKLFDYAINAEDHIYISNVVIDKSAKQVAIQKASELTNWTSNWPAYVENCNDKKLRKVKKYRKNVCISRTDNRQEILTISKRFAPDTFNKGVDAILSNTTPVSLGNFAEALSDLYKDDAGLQKKVEAKMWAIPATSVTLKDWANVRSTESIEQIVARKMAEAMTSSTELAKIADHMRLRYGSAISIVDITIASKCFSFDECLIGVKRYDPDSYSGLLARLRSLQFAKTNKQRKLVETSAHHFDLVIDSENRIARRTPSANTSYGTKKPYAK